MKFKFIETAIAGLILTISGIANAGLIQLNPDNSLYQVNVFEPIGQVFTAEDRAVKTGLSFYAMNSQSVPDTLIYELYDGTDVTGSLIGSLVDFDPMLSGFSMWDISSIELTIGNQYLLTVRNTGTSPYWGVRGNSDSYAGGDIYFGSLARIVPAFNLGLKVAPLASVSEPSALIILALGVFGFAARRFKK